jgi:hypothetical protein
MAVYADIDGIADRRPGGLPAGMETRCGAILEDVCAEIDLATGMTWSGPTDPNLPPMVVVIARNATLRKLDNPDGLTMVQSGGYMHQRPNDASRRYTLLIEPEVLILSEASGLPLTASPRTPIDITSATLSTMMGVEEVSESEVWV